MGSSVPWPPPSVPSGARTLRLSVVFNFKGKYNRTLNILLGAGGERAGRQVERCQLVPGLTLEAERNMHTSGRVVANHTTPSWNGPCILERNELKRLRRLL